MSENKTLKERFLIKFRNKLHWDGIQYVEFKDPAFNLETVWSWIEAEMKAEKEKYIEPIKTLLMLCEPDGTVVNGFKTKELITELRNKLNNK